MRQRVPSEATCAICGRHYDPSETRGWCPNPSCGEWQHPAFPIEEDAEEEADDDIPESVPTHPCPNCGKDVRADANFCSHCASQLTETEESEPDQSREETDGLSECPECSADLSGIPLDRLSTCPICRHDLTPLLDSTDTTTDAEITESAIEECPNCGEDLTPIPEDMRTVCPGCRFDLEGDIEAEHAPASTPLKSVVDISRGYVRRLEEVGITTVGDLVTAKPDLISAKTGIAARRIRGWIDEAPLDPDDFSSSEMGVRAGGIDSAGISHSPEAGENDPQRQSPEAEVDEGDSEHPSPETTEQASSGRQSPDTEASQDDSVETSADAETDQDDSVETSPDAETGQDDSVETSPDAESSEMNFMIGTDELGHNDSVETRDGEHGPSDSKGIESDGRSDRSDRHPDRRDESEDSRHRDGVDKPAEVVFEVRGQEITVTDGETVGKEIRYAMIESGDPEEEALYVHREHVRVDIDDQAYLTRIGENSVTVSGRPVEKGERVSLRDGDTVEFSDVVSATVGVR